jgi:hypothetical protein
MYNKRTCISKWYTGYWYFYLESLVSAQCKLDVMSELLTIHLLTCEIPCPVYERSISRHWFSPLLGGQQNIGSAPSGSSSADGRPDTQALSSSVYQGHNDRHPSLSCITKKTIKTWEVFVGKNNSYSPREWHIRMYVSMIIYFENVIKNFQLHW